MPITLAAVTAIAHGIARSVSLRLNVIGVILGGGGGGYTEIIFTMEPCRTEPCRIVVGVFRDTSEGELRNEIRRQLVQHVEEHPI